MLPFFLQIDRQLSAYMRRVEDVLGKGWENHVEGQRLKADGDSFRQKLNTQELFDEWSKKVGTYNYAPFFKQNSPCRTKKSHWYIT